MAMSGREAKIRAAKNAQYQEKRRRNQVEEQLQTAPQPYTVTDTDTIDSIAQANGVNPVDVLKQNPDVKNLQTGMVINVPNWQGSAFAIGGGTLPKPSPIGGLPSNAALGSTTTNPQGSNPYGPVTPPGYKPQTNQTWIQKAASMAGNNQTTPAPVSYQGSVAATAQAVGSGFNQYMNALTNRPPQPQGNTTTNQDRPVTNPTTPPAGFYMSQYQYFSRNLFHNQLRTKVETKGYMPTPGEVQILEKMGFIKKDPSGGGGGYSWSKGRGGGGGGRRSGGYGRGGGGVSRQPAFSSGNGTFGLVNWRI
jgi:hypothetical protein